MAEEDKASAPIHRDLDNSLVSLSRALFWFWLCTALSHMLDHVTTSANGKLYKIKINKYFFMRLLKRGDGNSLKIDVSFIRP